MKTRRISLLILIIYSLFISGCTYTMKSLKESYGYFSKGEIFPGIWTGTVGTAVMAIADVGAFVSMGGAVDPMTSANAIVSATNNNYKNPTPYNYSNTTSNYQLSELQNNATKSTHPMSIAAAENYGGSSSLSPSSTSSNNSSNSSLSDKYSRPMTECVSSEIDQSKSDKYGTYYRLTNKCQNRISVTHYVDGGSWGGHQGKGDLDPGQSTTTIKVHDGSNITYRACEIPAGKQWVTPQNTDGDGFMCLILQ